MSISEHKILSADLLNKQVTDAADRPTGTAQQIKYLFDRLALEVVIPALNALIDELTGSGAASVGTSVSGVAGTDVQTVLESMKAMIDDRYTKEQADGLLGDKADKTAIAPMLADMTIDDNGVITITRKNGTTKSWDTALEKIAVNFDFNPERQKLKLTLEDGTTKEVDLSAFVRPNEFADSASIDFTAGADGTVTATIRAGSVTDEMLDSAMKEALIAYRDAAASSAAAAKASENNALTYKQAAETARTGAEKAQTEAGISEINASVYAEGGTLAGHEGEIILQEELPGAKGYMLMAQQSANSAATSASAADTRANAAADSERNAEASKSTAATAAQSASESASAAQASKTAAETAKAAAAASASAAKASESKAAASQTAASRSAGEASSSASAAADSEKNAKASADAAAAHESAAAKSDSGAEASASAASASQAAAKTSETNAKTSESNAKASETAAAASETAAASSASAAKTSETNASASQTAAAASASAAKTSETNASASQKAAAASASAAKTSETNAADSAKRAEDAAARASEIVGGDFATKNELNAHAGDTTKHVTAAERTAWNAKAAKPTGRTLTLSASGWDGDSKTQTAACSNVSATETAQLITPVPALASQTAYYEAGILCTGQAANSLTFTCTTVPTEDLTVYVVIQEVTQG